MEWALWRPLYLEILKDFNFDPQADIESALVLSKLIDSQRIPNFCTIVDKLGKSVSICGAAASLENELGNLSADRTIISAGSATGRLMHKGIMPDVIVSDLDGEVEFEIEASAKGVLMFVHAHGDNIPMLRRVVPKLLGPIVPTVQCQPFDDLYNFGGFTDGDRCYVMAKHFGIDDIRFFGWDLANPFFDESKDRGLKRKKLIWAERIIKEY
ncbi:MAG: DUF115 domain-containing protein [Methanomassiliicoccales archaeon]|nr:DUF115 domain-containing protein [Methanomassiliicoccales archaeon]